MFRWWRQYPQSLEQWLATATRGLCDDARERIGEEIASHYEEALADARANGMSEADAIAAAVRSLGNPERARRKLQRQHFTKLEARSLKWLLDACRQETLLGDARIVKLKTIAAIIMAIAAPLVIIGLVIGMISVFDTGMRSNGAQTLKVGGGALVMIAAVALFMYAGGVVHDSRMRMPIWRRYHRAAVSSLFFSVLLVGGAVAPWGLIEYVSWQEANEPGIGPAERNGALVQETGISRAFLLLYATAAFGNLIIARWQFRFASKLRRLGYHQPPSTLV